MREEGREGERGGGREPVSEEEKEGNVRKKLKQISETHLSLQRRLG